MPADAVSTQCCIVGGGPAGVMLGYLLARSGIDVVVLEKHADFFRDFRGDTIHPSTLEVLHELGLLDDLLRLPHQKLAHIDGWVGEHRLTVADFSHLPTHCKFIAMMPQWDFLNFLSQQGGRFPNFHLRMSAEAVDLLRDGERISGVDARTAAGTLAVRADLVVAADGRSSIVRERAGLEIVDLGAPMDVLWMRIAKGPGDPTDSLGRFVAGHILVFIDRGDYWQLGYVIPKGGLAELHTRGLPALHDDLRRAAPFLGARVEALRTWDDVKQLTVRVDRLRSWYRPGLLCIGDAAHAMSPIGGVGINLAIQDAVAAGNMLPQALRRGPVDDDVLHAVQRRREWPTRVTQAIQVFAQNRVVRRVLGAQQPFTKLPFVLRMLQRYPRLQRLPARLIGIGVRPEHVQNG